jgi:hypothetical protein
MQALLKAWIGRLTTSGRELRPYEGPDSGSIGIPPHLSLPPCNDPVLIYSTNANPQSEDSKEGHMCPACIASTAIMVAGAGSTGGILAACISKFKNLFGANHLGLTRKEKSE